MTHNRMADTMANANAMVDSNTVADSNTMTNSDSMSNSNTMTDANTMSDPSKELRGGGCRSCQGRNDQRGLKVIGLIQSDQMT